MVRAVSLLNGRMLLLALYLPAPSNDGMQGRLVADKRQRAIRVSRPGPQADVAPSRPDTGSTNRSKTPLGLAPSLFNPLVHTQAMTSGGVDDEHHIKNGYQGLQEPAW